MTDLSTVHTTCPYCGVGCGVLVTRAGAGYSVRGDPEHPANRGRLCSKGAALGETLALDDRLLYPEIGDSRATWDAALDLVARRFTQAIADHGPESVAFYVSGQLLTEDYYVANKLMKGCIGSGNIDTNSRLCMSSAVAAQKRAFGADAVPACYEDLELADLVVLVGSNAAWTHPVIYQRLVAAKQARPHMRVVVIDPRRTATAELADLFLPLAAGSDAWLFNGLLNHLRETEAIDQAWVKAHVEDFDAAIQSVTGLTIADVARACALPEQDVATFYRLFTATPRTVTLFSQGINQSSSGVDKGNAIINCHLATGRIGQPGAAPFSMTGQPNAMGGREVGGLANQLAAHMDFTPEACERVARFWGVKQVAQHPGLKAVELFEAVASGKIKALWIMATNPAVSMPQADAVAAALRACPFVVVSDVVARTDTTMHAHVRLPAAAWGEKEGTVTNSERAISRQRAFLPVPGEARADWWMLCEVARRMGHGDHFPYTNAAGIFHEHAALSGFENEGTRDFDLSGLISRHGVAIDFNYDTLPPVQWPVSACGGTPRLFADARFFTPSGRARMLPVTPRMPVHAVDAAHPFLLNTGRVRDQWHTMTRTGKSARLFAHVDEPCLEIHPHDARRAGVRDGALARVSNASGTVLARVRETQAQTSGTVFVPIHWNSAYTGAGRVGVLTHNVTDPISGQPEFKQTPVAVTAFDAAWHGFVITREVLTLEAEYWARVRGKANWRLELAGCTDASLLPATLRGMSKLAGNWMTMQDRNATRHRGALLRDGCLHAVYFIERDAALLPPRHWLESLFQLDRLDEAARQSLLLGRPGAATPECGRIVCACFGVGENDLRQAIAAGDASVQALGLRLKAGTNCGSCVPELKNLLASA